jgi:hypothetical protein
MHSMRAGRGILHAAFWSVVWAGCANQAFALAPPYFEAFNQSGKIEVNLLGVPVEAQPALELEGLLARARAGEDPQQWVPGLRRFSGAEAPRGTAVALKWMAQCWEARAQVLAWDKLLRGAYRKKARFPESLDELLQSAPEALRKDPWGEAWAYRPSAPAHSPKLVGQRYQLGPSKFPELVALDVAGKAPASPRLPAGVALEFFSLASGDAQGSGSPVVSLKVKDNRTDPGQSKRWSGAYQPGDRFGDFWVVWIQRGGVLLGHPDGFLALAL